MATSNCVIITCGSKSVVNLPSCREQPYTYRSLLFQGAYNRETAENIWAAIAREICTALVSSRARVAVWLVQKLPYREAF